MGYIECIDALNMKSNELNKEIQAALAAGDDVTVINPHSMHNIGVGLSQKGKITVQGSTGFYTGGFLEGTSLTVEGNVGWYAGDNMMDGELIITQNAGCNAGAYFYGGTMIIRGSAGSRVGYGMKGGTIVVCGSAGRWAGQMTLGGRLVLLGPVGKQMGESMYKGVIYYRDTTAEKDLGGNVFLDALNEKEMEELALLFEKYDIDAEPSEFKAVRPVLTGRHSYTLFSPALVPEQKTSVSMCTK